MLTATYHRRQSRCSKYVYIIASIQLDLNTAKISRSPELKSLVAAAEEMAPERGASIFSAHVVEKLNKPGRDHKDNVRVVGLFKVPQHLTPDQHAVKFEALVDSIVAHPTIQKHMLGYTMASHPLLLIT
jgi:hypothetical protein